MPDDHVPPPSYDLHSHDADAGPVPAKVRLALAAAVGPLVVATLVGLLILWPDDLDVQEDLTAERARGTVTSVEPCGADAPPDCLQGQVELVSGVGSPGEVTALLPFGPGAPEVEAGDALVLGYVEEAPEDQQYSFLDFDRTRSLVILGVMFVVAVVALSLWRGIASLVSLAASLLLVTTFVLPALLEGASPLLVAVVGAAAIMIVTLYVTHGFNALSTVALIGTLISLALTGVLGTIFTSAARLSGLTDDASVFLGQVAEGVDLRGLLLAGLVIGALGVLDDVTVTQAATVWEVARANPAASRASLFAAGMRVGRSHVASTVNTLVLAYVGTALPLLLFFSVGGLALSEMATVEIIAQEIVRALVGALGIVAAVPVTTGIAAFVVHSAVTSDQSASSLRRD